MIPPPSLLNYVELPKTTPKTLLPTNWGQGSEGLLVNFAAACTGVQNKLQNFGHWRIAQDQLARTLAERLERLGVHTPPWSAVDFWFELVLEGPAVDSEAHQRLWRAWFTDATRLFWSQFVYRYKKHGNTQWDVGGDTGLGKSSQTMYVMVKVKEMLTGKKLTPAQLLDRLGFDPTDKIQKLPRLEPGDTFQDDDEMEIAGEGTNTVAKMERNVGGMLRKSRINKVRISPEIEAQKGTQARLRALMVHDDKWTLNMLYIRGRPVGLVTIPWVDRPFWEVYDPWKEANTQRVLMGQFGDRRITQKQALKLLQDSPVVKYLMTFDDQKPRIGDFEDCVNDRSEGMLTGDQKNSIAKLMMRMTFKFAKLAVVDPETGRSMFEELYGVPPPASVKKLAALWEGSEL